MIIEVNANRRELLYPLFENMTNTMILSCLEGHMGKAWTDNLENPTIAQVEVGVFTFYAGDVNSEVRAELLDNIPDDILVIVNSDDWKDVIEKHHKGKIDKFPRYAFKRSFSNFDNEMIDNYLIVIPDGYTLKKIDRDIAYSESFQNLSEDFTSQYESIDDYIDKGIGYCLLHEGEVVAAASSYSVYNEGIEIEVDTHPSHRRKGLATIVSAALIKECIERGIYPNWDAVSMNSVKLAEKFGYVLDAPYDTYYISKNRI